MVHQWTLQIETLNPMLTRRAYLYLPAAYETQPEARFPVLYMFDGQNVFFDSDASFGKSWGMADYLDAHQIPLIVAAVECSSIGNERIEEYSPFSHCTPKLGPIKPRGRETMEFLTKQFKPMIDAAYRTLPEREHTLIAGSSMGGLMSLYAVLHDNDVFSRAACLSPSLWINSRQVRRMIRSAQFASDTLIYMDYGGAEMTNHANNPKALTNACSDLFERGADLTFRVVPGGTHSEASWQQRLPICMQCLGF